MLISLLLLACHHDKDTTATDDTTSAADGSPVRSCDVVVSSTLPDGVKSVQIAGTFDDWTAEPLVDPDGDGTFTKSLGELHPGVYGYKFLYDGTYETTPADVYTTWNDGVENRALIVDDCTQPDLKAVSGSATADGTVTATFQFSRGSDESPLDTVTATIGADPVDARIDHATGLITVTKSGLSAGKWSVRVDVTDAAGRPAEHGQAYVPLWVESTPFQWQSGLMYFVFTDRFADGGASTEGPTSGTTTGTDWMGGDFVGAKQKIDDGYFDALGVHELWISPPYQNPSDSWIGSDGVTYYSGYHGYWPIRGRDVDRHWGTVEISPEQALHDLVDDAHQHGIRVVMDTVLNHVHQEHEYLTEHPDWFTASPCLCTTDPGPCNWDTNPVSCWFTSYLPDLDYKNHDIVDQMTSDLEWWLQTYDLDGFRVDAAKHMDHVILRTVSMSLRDKYETPGGAHIYTVGETFTGQGGQGLIMNYVAPYELDGQFDFPLLYPIRNAVGGGQSWHVLADEVHNDDAGYGASVKWMSTFMGNHDVTRYATDIQGCSTWSLFGGCPDLLASGAKDSISSAEWDVINKMSMSFAFVATQPGVPLLYYGDEIGLAGSSDPDNRRMMQFEGLSMSQSTLLGRFEELGQARNAIPALQTGARTELWVDDDLYVYARDNGSGDVAIVALCKGSTCNHSVPVPTGLALEGKTLTNALGDGTPSIGVSGGFMNVNLAQWQYVVWK